MKRKMLKKMSMVVAAAMLSTTLLGGCGEAKQTSKEGADEEVTLKVYSQQTYPGSFTSGVQDDPVSNAMKEATGVTLDWDMNPTDDKTNAFIASGDLPDIFCVSSVTNLEALIKSGAVMELTDMVETNMPDFLEVGQKAYDFSKKYLSAGTDKVYFIPGRITEGSADSIYYSPVIGFFMRLDYYKEAGTPKIANFNDVVDVAAKIQEQHPTTEDGQPTYIFSMWQDWGLWNYTVASEVIRSMAGVNGTTAKVAYKDTSDGNKFVNGIDDENSPLWVDSAMYNKAYRLGLMDPNSFTQTYDQATATMENGQVICQLAQWLTDTPNAKLAAEGTDAGYQSILMEDGAYSSSTYSPVGFASYWAVSSKCKYPEKALQVINSLYTDEMSRNMLCGVKGDTWDVDESGKAYLTEKGLTMKNDANYMTTTGARKFQNLTGIDTCSQDANGQYIDLFYEPDMVEKTLSDSKKSWLEMYGASSENELWHNNGGVAGNAAFDALFPTIPSDMARTDTQIASYLTTALPQLIMSESDEAFQEQKEKIQNDVKAIAGYQEYMDWCKESVESTAKALEEFK